MFWSKKKETPVPAAEAKAAVADITAEFPKKKVKICSSDFRDGQQSLFATRFETDDMVRILPNMDKVGFEAMEVWGGATFDGCIRYLNNDPWERLRRFKEVMKNTKTTMLLRGQNLIGYRQYPDDVVEKFVELAAKNGMDIFNVFDGLNDARNCETAIRAVKKAGKECCASILYTVSPIHNTEKLVETARAYQKLGVDSIMLVDMAGQMTPREAYVNTKALKDAIPLPLWINCHATGGMALTAYWEAIRAGADVVNGCVSNLSGGTSLPAIEAIIAMLQGTPADTGLDLDKFEYINQYIGVMREKYRKYLSQFTGVNVSVLKHQVPGGMLSNLESQLKQMHAISRLDEVFEEVQVVRKDMGYPPLATPFSQMVGTQATVNVLTGKRYGTIAKEVKDYVKGGYGITPGPCSEELKKLVITDEKEVITVRPGSLLAPEWEKLKKEAYDKGLAKCDEDAMTYILFPQVAEEFLKKKYGRA